MICKIRLSLSCFVLIMKGGILHLPQYSTHTEAIHFFTQNCTYKILTNSSISCITFICTLNPGILSPFISCRSMEFANPVNKILLKILPCNALDKFNYLLLPIMRGTYSYIELNTYNTVLEEFNTQRNVYLKSYSTNTNLFDAICPFPISCEFYTNKQDLIDFIINDRRFIPRDDRDINQEREEIRTTLGYTIIDVDSLSCIFMEFMDGFETYKDIVNKLPVNRQKLFESMARYELDRLHKIGYLHGDYHIGNIMVNPNYKYFTLDENSENCLGRVLIIDFGRSKPIPIPNDNTVINEPTRKYDGSELIYHEPYNYNMMRDQRMRIRNLIYNLLSSDKYKKKIQYIIKQLSSISGGKYTSNVKPLITKLNGPNVEHKMQKSTMQKTNIFNFHPDEYNHEYILNLFTNNKSIDDVFKLVETHVLELKSKPHIHDNIETTVFPTGGSITRKPQKRHKTQKIRKI